MKVDSDSVIQKPYRRGERKRTKRVANLNREIYITLALPSLTRQVESNNTTSPPSTKGQKNLVVFAGVCFVHWDGKPEK